MRIFRLPFFRSKSRRVYLDYAAATPVHASVRTAMEPYWSGVFANPGGIHTEGRAAAEAVQRARGEVGRTLAVRPDEVTFTSGGTEANNVALFGAVHAALAAGRALEDIEVITTQIEHPSITEPVRVLSERGVRVVYTPVDTDGRIVRTELQKRITSRTYLIAFGYVNSEVGTIEDVKRITHLVRTYRKEHPDRQLFVHLDAAQAPLWLPCRADMLGVDLMSLDGAKCYGPKGSGILVHRRHVPISAIVYGGGQESGLRSGTENVPLIVGCARALTRAQAGYTERTQRVQKLREHFFTKLMDRITDVVVNGSRDQRVANNVNISPKGVDGEYAVVSLDVAGIAASTKSACGSRSEGGSQVVRTLSGDDDRARSTVRFTLGEETTRRDIDRAVDVLARHVALVRGV